MTHPEQPDALQFDQAEAVPGAAGAAAGMVCTSCKRTLTGIYHMLNAQILCSTCRQRLEREWKGGSGTGRFGKALLYGMGGAIAGAIVYYAVLALLDLEVGLIAILVGYLVGKGVRKGSGARGGFAYQSMAVLLTYFAIVSTYIPFVVKGVRERAQREAAADSSRVTAPALTDSLNVAVAAATDSSAVTTPVAAKPRPRPTFGKLLLALGAMLIFAAILPFMMGISNVIGLLIIGFALFQAWKMNKRPHIAFSGPYHVGGMAPKTA